MVEEVQDQGLHQRFADRLFEESGFDLRGQEFDPFYVGKITNASSVDLEDNKLKITTWKPGRPERAAEKT
ncbi:MAG: hypothetical protein ABR609_10285 [Acidimicrobiia bacterium]